VIKMALKCPKCGSMVMEVIPVDKFDTNSPKYRLKCRHCGEDMPTGVWI